METGGMGADRADHGRPHASKLEPPRETRWLNTRNQESAVYISTFIHFRLRPLAPNSHLE